MHIGKEEMEQSLLTDDIVIYMENPKISTQEATKTNIQKSVIFLCISNK